MWNLVFLPPLYTQSIMDWTCSYAEVMLDFFFIGLVTLLAILAFFQASLEAYHGKNYLVTANTV